MMKPANDNATSLAAQAFREVNTQLRMRGASSACAIFEAARIAIGLPEEECGGAIHDAIFQTVRHGLATSNTYDLSRNTMVFGQQTVLAPAPVSTH